MQKLFANFFVVFFFFLYTFFNNHSFIDFPSVNPISMEEAQSLVRNGELKYKDLSQAIHPILGTPFLHLHPCMSHELLQITSNR